MNENYTKISYEEKNDIVYIGFGKNEEKSLTTFSPVTLQELQRAVGVVKSREQEVKALVFYSHKPGCFLAGVDVDIIRSLKTAPAAQEGAYSGQQIFNTVEDLSCMTIALVDGICLGGGLELALSCDVIVASDGEKTKLGLPEVMLGVLPGFGGTYRLPKKIGLMASMDMMLSGKQVDAKKAFKLGLVELVVPRERLLPLVSSFIKGEYLKRGKKESWMQSFMETGLLRKIVFQKAREKTLSLTKGFYPAPLKIIDHLEKSYGRSREDYLLSEAEAFGELSQTTQSKNLQNVFFLTDHAKKFDKSKATVQPKRGAVIGAGVMGGGIAWLLAENHLAPIMKDVKAESLELGLKQAAANFKAQLKRKKINEDEFDRKVRSITPTLQDELIGCADFVIEAVVEDLAVKQKVLTHVEGLLAPSALLTTNTSSLSIEAMAASLKRPAQFAGLHFFNPVHKMPLVEIVTHPLCSEETIQSLIQWVVKIKKTPVVVKNGPGFLVNRILATYLNEAGYLFEEGVSIKDMDQAALDFGMPMGPCRLMDEVGLDVSAKVGKILHTGLGQRMLPNSLGEKLLAAGLLGKKNNKGFYTYHLDAKNPSVNTEVESWQAQKKSVDPQYLQMRLILPMINEAAHCLQDGIVAEAKDIDTALIYGIGFPPFRGGLLRFADELSLARLKPFFDEFSSQVSLERYSMAPLLTQMINGQKSFYHE
jgi:3-hydroxyacyl-CoA dehydrogenase/enoyl-CoA hydratase/3-hydroxybutyryl-CoA epimerase